VWRLGRKRKSDALSVAFLEARRDGSRGAVACRLAADGEQRDKVLERKERILFQQGVGRPAHSVVQSRQESVCECVWKVKERQHSVTPVRECKVGSGVGTRTSYQKFGMDHRRGSATPATPFAASLDAFLTHPFLATSNCHYEYSHRDPTQRPPTLIPYSLSGACVAAGNRQPLNYSSVRPNLIRLRDCRATTAMLNAFTTVLGSWNCKHCWTGADIVIAGPSSVPP